MNKTTKIASALLVLVLMLGVFVGCGKQEEEQEIYRLYFGLNDATTGTQLLTAEEGAVKSNTTLLYELFFVPKKDMETIVDKAKEELNLASVLVTTLTSVEYHLD